MSGCISIFNKTGGELEDITQIRIGNHMTGIIGLKEVLKKVAEKASGLSDADIAQALMENLSQKNYIPHQTKELYKDAFLREFKKHIGEPVKEDDAFEGIEIKVLGAGCPTCDRLEQDLMAAIEQTGVRAGLEHIRDVKQIARYHVLNVPAIVINNKVVSEGQVMSRSELINLLQKTVSKLSKNSV